MLLISCGLRDKSATARLSTAASLSGPATAPTFLPNVIGMERGDATFQFCNAREKIRRMNRHFGLLNIVDLAKMNWEAMPRRYGVELALFLRPHSLTTWYSNSGLAGVCIIRRSSGAPIVALTTQVARAWKWSDGA